MTQVGSVPCKELHSGSCQTQEHLKKEPSSQLFPITKDLWNSESSNCLVSLAKKVMAPAMFIIEGSLALVGLVLSLPFLVLSALYNGCCGEETGPLSSPEISPSLSSNVEVKEKQVESKKKVVPAPDIEIPYTKSNTEEMRDQTKEGVGKFKEAAKDYASRGYETISGSLEKNKKTAVGFGLGSSLAAGYLATLYGFGKLATSAITVGSGFAGAVGSALLVSKYLNCPRVGK